MNIYSVALNIHDHNTYDGTFHNQIERHNRRKHNLNYDWPHDPNPSKQFFMEHVLPKYKSRDADNQFAFTISNLGYQFVEELINEHFVDQEFTKFKPRNIWEPYYRDNVYYIDHHQSHGTYALLSSGYEQSDVLAIDGRGWKFSCIFINSQGDITDLSKKIPIGGLWNRLSQDIGFKYLDAGKVMGLAGYGAYNHRAHAMIEAYLMDPNHTLPKFSHKVIERVAREDIAFTLQKVTIDLVKQFVYPLKSSENICVAGGVAYNGYMNEELTKQYKNVHVPPAVGDEGQALGTYMHAKYFLEGEVHIPTVYAGKEYEYKGKNKLDMKEVAQAIADGKIVGWFQGKSESGNRALGNRSILADPRNPNIKDVINSKIKKREDFRPFAPSVLYEHYQDYFDTNQPSPYMSRIMPVTSGEIPGVTHIDGTARIQTVKRSENELYYDLINEFYKLTGIPMVLNTSFNCQEPIVETPQDAIETFNKTDLDMLVINDWSMKK